MCSRPRSMAARISSVRTLGFLPSGRIGFADDDADRAGLFNEPAPRPVCAGIVRQRHHQLAGGGGEQGAAHSRILARLPRRHARALRKDDDPQPIGKPRLALFDHLVDGPVTLSPIDGDRPQHLQSPADERDPQQLALEHPHLRREDHEWRDRFPGRGVIAHDDVIALRNALAPLHREFQAAEPIEQPKQNARPGAGDGELSAIRQPETHPHECAEQACRHHHVGGEQQRAQPLHGSPQPGRRDRSATPPSSCRASRSSASRLSRSSGFSSMTMVCSKKSSTGPRIAVNSRRPCA